MLSVHPYEPFVPKGAAKLIIGTMPPYRFCVKPQKLFDGDVDFYYGSRDNAFWYLIEQATGETFDCVNTQAAIAQRKAFLEKRKMGVTDIVKSCVHRNGKSDDISLCDIEPKPVAALLAQHPTIDTLIYTGRSNQNNSVMRLMNCHVADRHYHSSTANGAAEKSVIVGGRTYRVILLYSPSPNALRSVDAATRLAQYRTVFGE